MLDLTDKTEIAAIMERAIAPLWDILRRQMPPDEFKALPGKLTVEQFAWCVQRSAYHIRQRRRLNREFRKHCQGLNPILIHPRALELFGVDSSLAAVRLAQFSAPFQGRSIDKPAPPQS